MENFASCPVVAVILSPDQPPQLVELSEGERGATNFLLGETLFADTGTGDWQGFYDWLRNTTGEVLGVRQYIDDGSSILFELRFTGVEADKNDSVVRIYFGRERNFDEASSCDQSFGNNRILVAENKVALTFWAGHLK